MLNLKIFLVLLLISFSFQDKNCLSKWRMCIDKNFSFKSEEGSIQNCFEYDDENSEECEECMNGYALSSNRKSCISFPNCEELGEGNQKCIDCRKYFRLNSDGQCVPTSCIYYENEGKENEICNECYNGYYLNDKSECIKIPIENCKKYDKATKKCTKCLGNIVPNEDGNCIQDFIEGCTEYSANGKCAKCDPNEYTLKTDGTCEFNNCGSNEKVFEYCEICQFGYEIDIDGICIGADGSKDTSSSENNKVELSLLFFILTLMI